MVIYNLKASRAVFLFSFFLKKGRKGGKQSKNISLVQNSHLCHWSCKFLSQWNTVTALCICPSSFSLRRPSPPSLCLPVHVKKKRRVKCIANATASVQPDLSRAHRKRTSTRVLLSSHRDFPSGLQWRNRRRLLCERNPPTHWTSSVIFKVPTT